jgi:hypothetical protein
VVKYNFIRGFIIVSSISVCSSDVMQQCQYLRANVENGSNEPTSVLIEKVKRALSSIEFESNKGLPFEEKDCTKVSRTLGQRKVSMAVIVTAWFFFFLIIPAILAYFADKNNRELQLQIVRLHNLSDTLRRNSPINRIGAFNETLVRLRSQLDLLPVIEDVEQGSLLTSNKVKKINSISSIQSEVRRIHAEIAQLQDTCLELESRFPGQLSAFPIQQMRDLQEGLAEFTVLVEAQAGQARLLLEGETSEKIAGRFRDVEIDMARAKIAEVIGRGLPAQSQRVGIINGGNSCYMASVIQAMRLNPVTRYLVDRELPQKEFNEASGRTGLTRSSSDFDLTSKQVQKHLRDLFETLDSGRAVSTDQINRFRELLGAVNSVWSEKPNGYYQQQDAQEFRVFLEKILLLNTIQAPLLDDECFVSDLQQISETQTIVFPYNDLLLPSDASKNFYVVHTCIEYKPTHMVPFENPMFVYNDNQSVISVLANVDQCYIEKAMGFSSEEFQNYNMDARDNYDSPDARALKARLKTPGVRNGGTPVMQGEDGQYYQIGRVLHLEVPKNNPASLTFDLKRTVSNPLDGESFRAAGATPFPESFERDDVSDPTRQTKVTYEISSCVCHLGSSPKSGHYINYTKIQGQWYCFNDGSVYPAPEFNPARSTDLYFVQYNKVV